MRQPSRASSAYCCSLHPREKPQRSDSSLTNITLGQRLTDCTKQRARMDRLLSCSHRSAAAVPARRRYAVGVCTKNTSASSKIRKVAKLTLLEWTFLFAPVFYSQPGDFAPPPAVSPSLVTVKALATAGPSHHILGSNLDLRALQRLCQWLPVKRTVFGSGGVQRQDKTLRK